CRAGAGSWKRSGSCIRFSRSARRPRSTIARSFSSGNRYRNRAMCSARSLGGAGSMCRWPAAN
ncbi:MAG: hypothetical protein ACK559_17235, partial [bacterium]